ncbi:short-chain dehydrogenase [Patescibacteria group bacterium]|nr:short-chain dehydrogenase [Patescibacteria group bacterium]
MNEDLPTENEIEVIENEIPDSPREFHLEMPLYKEIIITEENLKKISELIDFSGTIDAYCIYCEKESVFENYVRPGFGIPALRAHAKSESEKYFGTSYICSRSRAHEYTSYFRICGSVIQKVGQFPSVADLQIPQIQKYRKLLGNEKYKEFTRALGLAAHGVGIGSFVYLRRIFEDLIEKAHSIASQNPEFNESEYKSGRIEEKISLLKDFLPEFLVKHKSIYSILSKGIHELSEEECLKHFNPIRVGIELVLDKKLKELDEEKKEKEASETISKITTELKTDSTDQDSSPGD